MNEPLDEIPQVVEINVNVDPADVLESLGKVLDAGSDARVRSFVTVEFSRQLSDLEKLHAHGINQFLPRWMDAYEYSADRRYQVHALRRALLCGLGAKRDQEQATAGAFAEMQQILREVEAHQQRQIADAIRRRMPLLEYVAGSRAGGADLALSLLRRLMPERVEQFLAVRGPTPEERGS